MSVRQEVVRMHVCVRGKESPNWEFECLFTRKNPLNCISSFYFLIFYMCHIYDRILKYAMKMPSPGKGMPVARGPRSREWNIAFTLGGIYYECGGILEKVKGSVANCESEKAFVGPGFRVRWRRPSSDVPGVDNGTGWTTSSRTEFAERGALHCAGKDTQERRRLPPEKPLLIYTASPTISTVLQLNFQSSSIFHIYIAGWD